MSEALAPIAGNLDCPFCAGDLIVVEDRGDNQCEPLLHRPQCCRCGGGLGGFDRRSDAIAAWNHRPSYTESEGVREALLSSVLLEALRPFAKLDWPTQPAEALMEVSRFNEVSYRRQARCGLSVGDFRRARDAVSLANREASPLTEKMED